MLRHARTTCSLGGCIMKIRRFREEDAKQISNLICRCGYQYKNGKCLDEGHIKMEKRKENGYV